MKWCEKCKDYVVCALTDKKPKCFTDRKTENNSEKPNNSTISKMEQVDKDINVRSKDEPQTERSE